MTRTNKDAAEVRGGSRASDRKTPGPGETSDPQPTAAGLQEQRQVVRRLVELILDSKTPTGWHLRRWLFSRRTPLDE